MVETAKNDWAEGAFIGESSDAFALRQAKELGGVQAVLQIANLEEEDFVDAEDGE